MRRILSTGSSIAAALSVIALLGACGSSKSASTSTTTAGSNTSASSSPVGSSPVSTSSSPVSTVTLGNVEDFSGPASVYGAAENEGAQIAVDQLNAAGGIKSLGGAQLAIKKYDTASNPDNAIPQATAAVGDKVTAVFGGEISDTVLAGINVTQRAGIPWVDTGGTANEIAQRGYNTVDIVVHDSTQFSQDFVNVIEQAAQQLHLSAPTVAIAYSDSSYGQDLYNAFTKINASAGLKVVTSFNYPLSTTDFSSVAARLAASNATVLFNMGYPEDGLNISRLFATRFRTQAKVWVAAGSDANDVVSQLKTQANGTILNADIGPQTKGAPASFTTFYNAYKAKFNAVPNAQSLTGYEAVQFIAAALEHDGSTSPAKLAAALRTVTLTQTTGNIFPAPATLSFGSDGTLTQAPFFAAQIVSGAPVTIYPPAAADASIALFG